MNSYKLEIETESYIPVDVLMEHLGYAIRAGLQNLGDFDITVSGRRGIAHKYYPKEEH